MKIFLSTIFFQSKPLSRESFVSTGSKSRTFIGSFFKEMMIMIDSVKITMTPAGLSEYDDDCDYDKS